MKFPEYCLLLLTIKISKLLPTKLSNRESVRKRMKILNTENIRRVNGNRPSTPEYPEFADPYILGTGRSHSIEPMQNSKNVTWERIKTHIIYILVILVILLIGMLSYTLVIILENKADVLDNIIDKAADVDLPNEQKHWYDHAINELRRSVKSHRIKHQAKNVILFMGDGMGVSTVTAARIYKYGEDGQLSWESFPHTGLLKVNIFLFALNSLSEKINV